MTTVLQFKQQLESIKPSDIMALRAIKADKTLNTHLERIKLGKFEKSEINALAKIYATARFATDERKLSLEALRDLTMDNQDCINLPTTYGSPLWGEIYHFKKPSRITKEQTDLGKAYLKNHYFKKDGSPRRGKNTEDVSTRVLKIAASVKRFEFVGLLFVKTNYGHCNQVLPIYRTFNSKSEYYDYAPVHWGQPVVMEGY